MPAQLVKLQSARDLVAQGEADRASSLIDQRSQGASENLAQRLTRVLKSSAGETA